MGIVYHRPVNGVDYGDGSPTSGGGSGYPLGDGSDSSYKRYISSTESGTILVYPTFAGAGIPVGRQVIAVCAGHRERQTKDLIFADNGWVMTYLRVGGKRQTQIRAYTQDGSHGWRDKLSAPLYKKGYAGWTNAEISTMSTDTGIATGEFGPSRSKMWCRASESFLALVYDEPLVTPSVVNTGTYGTVSLNLSADIRAPQTQQPVQPVWQLARNAAFTDDVREFAGPFTASATDTRVTRTSSPRDLSYTNLAPGVWHIRAKARDIRGEGHESGWSAARQITIELPTPPQAQIVNPGSIVPTPYGQRAALVGFTGDAPGGRAIGIEWLFTGPGGRTVRWVNTQDAILYGDGTPVRYIADPDPTVKSGLNGDKVGVADPDQYLIQGAWAGQARGVDRFGITGPWSAVANFTVSHPPVVLSATPALGGPIDATRGVLSWAVGDPWSGDRQSGAIVELRDGATLIETITQAGSATSMIPGAWEDLTPWMRKTVAYAITSFDLDEVASSPPFQGTFLVSREPDITILSPQPGELIPTGNPVFTWTSVFAAAGLSQRSARVVVKRVDNGAVAFDGDANPGSVASVTQAHAPLDNLTDYLATVTVVDTEGLPGSATVQFTTSFVRPAPVASYPRGDEYSEHGFVVVEFDNSTIDPEFSEWRIYRRRVELGSEWALAGTEQDPDASSFKDWLVAGSGEWEYATVQVAVRFGSPVESLRDEFPSSVSIFSDSYWLIVPGMESESVQLHTVTGDDYTSERETAEYVIIGGGRRRNIGTIKGKSGSLSAAIRHSTRATPTQQVRQLEDLNRESRPVIMRDPFGNLTQVSLGEIAVSRIAGVGSSEFADLTIPYFEVM